MRFTTSRQISTFSLFCSLNNVIFVPVWWCQYYVDIPLRKLDMTSFKTMMYVIKVVKKLLRPLTSKKYQQAKWRRRQSVCRITRRYISTWLTVSTCMKNIYYNNSEAITFQKVLTKPTSKYELCQQIGFNVAFTLMY